MAFCFDLAIIKFQKFLVTVMPALGWFEQYFIPVI